MRVGTDLVSVDRVRESLALHGEHYLRRVYTAGEVADCAGPDGALAPERLAARFAGKEAVMKLLRPTDHDAVPWPTIEVLRAPHGAPGVRLHAAARELAEAAELGEIALSLSHEDGLAVAFAVAAQAASDR